ncbi:MAG: FliH/SctL family protein [Terriglobales bacterium]
MKNSSSERTFVVEKFVYRDHGTPEEEPSPARRALVPPPPAGISEDEAAAREEQARQTARTETEARLTAVTQSVIASERQAVATALEGFAQQRELYFLHLEREIVQLALGIARRVLHREAQMDPLFLAGSVRLALDRLASGTRVDLFMPPSQQAQWEDLLIREPMLAPTPALHADAALEPNGCRLETSTGSTDLGLDPQLQEIERGFADLLSRRTALVHRTAAVS